MVQVVEYSAHELLSDDESAKLLRFGGVGAWSRMHLYYNVECHGVLCMTSCEGIRVLASDVLLFRALASYCRKLRRHLPRSGWVVGDTARTVTITCFLQKECIKAALHVNVPA